MKLILASDIFSNDRTRLMKDNGFLDKIKSELDSSINCVFVPSNPFQILKTNANSMRYQKAFERSGFNIRRWDILPSLQINRRRDLISKSNLIILSGGHVPTENRYFHAINLAKSLRNYSGLIIGISAGSMNSAENVYAQPEKSGEATSKRYKKFLKGLGLTDISVIPHYDKIIGEKIDGLRIIQDITLPDSIDRKFYAIDDTSFIVADERKSYGNCYLIENGRIIKVCTTNQISELP